MAITLSIIIKKRIKDDDTSDINNENEQNSNFNQPKKENGRLDQRNLSDKKTRHHIDIKGAISLALSISSFLLTLTYFANTNSGSNNFTSIDGIVLGLLVTLTMCSMTAFVSLKQGKGSVNTTKINIRQDFASIKYYPFSFWNNNVYDLSNYTNFGN